MRFPYVPLKTRRPVYPLGGVFLRHRAIVPVEIIGPKGSRLLDCSLDNGTDDTLLPKQLAILLGVKLTTPPDEGEALPVGGKPIKYPYGHVKLRITDGTEAYE